MPIRFIVKRQTPPGPSGTFTLTSRTPAEQNQWTSVCWSPEEELFVAVAQSGTNRVMTSPDGITWTARTCPSQLWQSVAWGAGSANVFVAVGGNDDVMSSPDGITWTTRTGTGQTSAWKGVAWSPILGLFAAVSNTSSGNIVMTSPDGITWATRTSAANNGWQDVCWFADAGLFVAVGNTGTGNRVMTSPDGINWTTRTSAADVDWFGVTAAEELGLVVAVANSGAADTHIMTSPDGINWTIRADDPEKAPYHSVAYAPELDLFLAVGDNNNTMTSEDGTTWTQYESAPSGWWYDVAYSPSLYRFVAVDLFPGNVMTGELE
jgi:hypothetical protein